MILKFETLWKSYPSEDEPCETNGKSNFSNQCAIRVGIALAKAGVDTSGLNGVTHCWFHPKQAGHVIRAEELAKGIDAAKVEGLASGIDLDAKNFKRKLAGRTGIIFFKDYWQRDRDADGIPTGDHIDLWKESRLTDWSSWLRVQLGIVMPGFWSDLEKAKVVRFWEVK